MDDRYLVRASDGLVEQWSAVRLPFEPKGWQLEMRAALRNALTAMASRSNTMLHATYAAADSGEFVDVENVLLYNVGSRSLRPLMAAGIRFERAYAVPEPPVRLPGGPALHYQRYELTDGDAAFAGWETGQDFASVSGIKVNSLDQPGPVWAAIRAQGLPPARTADAPCGFVAHVRLSPPSRAGRPRSITDVIKPLLDGIISAFHSHDQAPDDRLLERLCNAGLGGEHAELRGELTERRWAALGSRNLVQAFRERGVKWNPADDFCVAAEIVVDARGQSAGWEFDATLSAAKHISSPRSE